MKDGLGAEAVDRIQRGLSAALPGFEGAAFSAAALDGLEKLELKKRVRHLIEVLRDFLPSDFSDAAAVLSNLKTHWHRGDPGDPLRGFAAWPLIDYVGVHGLENPEVALPLLRELTPLFSAEFAIRPFLLRHTSVTLSFLQRWALDPDDQVRRLVSEGTRPRLPWGMRLKPFMRDPDPVLDLLEVLKDDPSRYVQRSVANNLNDISTFI